MSDVAIRVENLSKQYKIGAAAPRYNTFRDSLTNIVTTPFRRAGRLLRGQASGASDLTETIWALNHLTFEIKHGESVGFIGHNGAGKSTLLKILSRITEPTDGYADIYGRVGALLEVGTGFHPELTGRENIYLNAAILGMKRAEIERKFDEIVDFAEIAKFIDTPVKHYSSGMSLRLGFAVAAHLEPEVLVVDEVLAVGDARFQQKCIGKMNSSVQQGRTLLFVSHNLMAIQSLCEKVIWLNQGEVMEVGDPTTVIHHYLGSQIDSATEQVWDNSDEAPGNRQVRIRRIAAHPLNGTLQDPLTTHTPVMLECEYWSLQPDVYLDPHIVIETDQGMVLFESYPFNEQNWHGKLFPTGLYRSTCVIPPRLLNGQMYYLRVNIFKNEREIIYKSGILLALNLQLESDEARIGLYQAKMALHPQTFDWNTSLLRAGDPVTVSDAADPPLLEAGANVKNFVPALPKTSEPSTI
ncbi:MAG: ABC transporter ATP-binding protein [Chloroflexota bacterium]|nr:ABC transporter ATP-binding protein [Chloroflexota bacterium]